eukprot:6214638-Pleurochrysis_carterae.AAC.9
MSGRSGPHCKGGVAISNFKTPNGCGFQKCLKTEVQHWTLDKRFSRAEECKITQSNEEVKHKQQNR